MTTRQCRMITINDIIKSPLFQVVVYSSVEGSFGYDIMAGGVIMHRHQPESPISFDSDDGYDFFDTALMSHAEATKHGIKFINEHHAEMVEDLRVTPLVWDDWALRSPTHFGPRTC